MTWFRTAGGRLIHGEGGLAAVYAARGWQEVPDDVADAEVSSGEAQARADVEGEAAAAVDEATRRAEGQQHTVPAGDGSGLLTTSAGSRPLTDEEQQLVDQTIGEESTGGSVRD